MSDACRCDEWPDDHAHCHHRDAQCCHCPCPGEAIAGHCTEAMAGVFGVPLGCTLTSGHAGQHHDATTGAHWWPGWQRRRWLGRVLIRLGERSGRHRRSGRGHLMAHEWVSVWCYDECHSICLFAAGKNGGHTNCECRCHDA